MMNVSLVAYTPEPEKIIAAAAKMCYSSAKATDLLDGLDSAKIDNYIKMITSLGHESTIEHVSFTFAVEGVSRSLLAQLTRHRIASYSVKSQRYVREGSFEYVIPPEIEAIPEAKEIFLKLMIEDQAAYDELSDLLQKKHYETFLSNGIPEKKARQDAEKMAIEDARYVLPNACETQVLLTMNVRSLFHFFKLRCCMRAQWEIRELAEKMLKLCYAVSPALFSKAGPSCTYDECSEGKMCCGNQALMREKYGNLM
ncbi:MAG: FAD-dependent thymidylate synthase [Clostridiales bacterium]|nr:FAD-dependent thymidylate synthase [Clostridiales bacterium]